MPDYVVTISKTIQKQLNNLPENDAEKIIAVIHGLAKNPRPSGYKKLKGREGYRIRKGNFRILYEIFDCILIVNVIAIGHLRNIYR